MPRAGAPAAGGADEPEGPEGVRLQKVLARLGYGSRRVCDDLIESGRVLVNGERAVLGRRVDPLTDIVAVDGVEVGILPGLVYYLLNKPAGVITSAGDPEGRRVVTELVPAEPRVFPVGRLDSATEGLLLLTNDGPLANRVAHPSHGVEKEYLAEVRGDPTDADLRILRRGVDIGDETPTAPAKVTLVGPRQLRIVIHEGRNKQVRRMCDAVGHPVLRLVRTRIGPITDNRLRPGEWRELDNDEVRALSAAATPRPARSRTAPDRRPGSPRR